MIVNKYNNGGGSGSGGTNTGQVQTMINNSLSAYTENLENGDPIVGMAAQLYSPDGVTSEGTYAYRTTAGDADVATGDAELRVLKGNSDYSNVQTSYDTSVYLLREGEPVEGFTYSIGAEEWVTLTSTEQTAEIMPTKARTEYPLGDNTNSYFQFKVGANDNADMSQLRVYKTNGNYTINVWEASICTAITANQKWAWSRNGVSGFIEFDGEYFTAYISDPQEGQYIKQIGWSSDSPQYFGGEIAIEYPDDIELGEHTYDFEPDGWNPSLPERLHNMEINGSTYEPSLGDEISIIKEMIVEGSAVYPRPTNFVALGLNSFDWTTDSLLTNVFDSMKKYYYESGTLSNESDDDWCTYSIKAVAGLANGYVIHIDEGSFSEIVAGVGSSADSSEAVLDFSTTELVDGNLVVYPTSEKPYIILSVRTDNQESVCAHPRWSGKMDDAFEEYSESLIDLSNLSQYPLYSVGDYRNELDLKNGVFKEYITAEPFDAENLAQYINDGKVLGVDIAYDENYIYIANNEPTEIDISEYGVSTEYKDNDFSVEYFVAYDDEDNTIILPQPVYAENFYITNLVDKLRRLDVDFIHLDSIETEGKVGKTYEYQGRLMQWVEGSGYTAEWLRPINELGSDEGEGLIYSTIPEGQILFEMYYSSYTHRNVVYRNQTLYLMEGDNVISSATVGSSFKFECNGISSRFIQGRFVNGHIGFYKASTTVLTNVWDGKANGSHYELIDKYNYPYSNPNQGIPVWNSKGQVIGLNYGSINTKTIYINATGTSTNNRLNVVTSSFNNGPDRWFAPVTGGAQGQTLVSAGDNAAPTWETRIKVVKITSDAYEALVQAGTTDPNTLYAIVDE